jgi:hypothetical protein
MKMIEWDAFIKAGRTTYLYSVEATTREVATKKAQEIANDLGGRVTKILVSASKRGSYPI